jgi:MATE family multidrug resistance protein
MADVTSDAAPSSAAPVFRPLLRLAWPIAVAQVGLVALGLEDVAIIGHSSVSDLAGAAMARTVAYSCACLSMGVAMTLEPLASQALGAREPRRASAALDATARAVILTWAVGVALSFAITGVLPWLDVEPDVVDRCRLYMLGQAPGFYFYGLFAVHKTFLQANGHTRPALVASVVANLVNVVTCTLLVRGDEALMWLHLPPIGLPALGAFGAGLASTIASVVLAVLTRAASLRARVDPGDERVALRSVLRLGVPVGAQSFAEMAVFTVVALLAGHLGKTTVSAHQIAMGLSAFTYMAAMGVSGATAVVVGRAIGAGESPRRAGLAGIALGAALMSVPAVAFAVLPVPLASLFTGDAGVIAQAVGLLRIAAVFQLFDGVQAVATGALRGAADVRYPFLVNVVVYWVVGLPIALVLGFVLGGGAPGLWWGLTLGLVLAAFVLARRFAVLASRPIRRYGG